MRISDWSSDVCSSDLTEIIVVRGSGALQPADGDNVQGSSLIAYPEFGLGSRIENRLRDEAGIVPFRRSDGRSAHPPSQGVPLPGLGGHAATRALVTLAGLRTARRWGGKGGGGTVM